MNNFKRAYKAVIEHEGYYANVIGDKGGETYMGIARNIHPKWSGWGYVDFFKNAAADKTLPRNYKIKNTDLDEAVEKFYFDKYWVKNGMPLVKNYSLQYIIFDWCVNSGRYGAKHVQRLVGARADGIIGKRTASAINRYEPSHLFTIIKAARINYYKAIATGQNEQFLAGWLNRINSFNYLEV